MPNYQHAAPASGSTRLPFYPEQRPLKRRARRRAGSIVLFAILLLAIFVLIAICIAAIVFINGRGSA